MSHFKVLVIGENPEEQLKPYDENIRVMEYITDKVSDEYINRFIEVYTTFTKDDGYSPFSEKEAEENKNLSFDELYKKYGEEWNGYGWKKIDDIWYEVSDYNPNSKWDWYVVGGRWNNYFNVKDSEEKSNQLLKGEIDVVRMRDEAENNARKRYNDALEIFGGVIPTLEFSWKQIINPNDEKFNTMSIEEKRNFYYKQEGQLILKELMKNEHNREKLGVFFDLEDFQCSEDEFVQMARNKAYSTYAVVKDGEWYEKGKMGWWGVSTDEKDNWIEQFAKLFDEIPDDTMVTLYDCHI